MFSAANIIHKHSLSAFTISLHFDIVIELDRLGKAIILCRGATRGGTEGA